MQWQKKKGLVTPTTELTYDPLYDSFSEMPASRIFYPEVLGINDELIRQFRSAFYKVGRGILSINEAIEQFGTL